MTPVDDPVAVIRGLIAREPDAAGGTTGLLPRVCRAAVRALSASGVGISVMAGDGTQAISATSDRVSEGLEELQLVLGEGPCIDAFTGRRPVLVPDLSNRGAQRWPIYAPAAGADGVRAVFAFPLQIGAAQLGVMDVFRARPGALTSDELRTALLFADVTVEALLDRQEKGDLRAGAAVDVGHRAQVFQAQGMVMVQMGISIAEAMVRMRAHAYAESRRLEDVARDVVDGVLRFHHDRA